MAKLVWSIKLLSDEQGGDNVHRSVIEEVSGVYDLDTTKDTTKGVVPRLRILLRRELIRRGLITATEDDRTK